MNDPAALLFIDKWISATRGMRGAEKGWYLDLILYQYGKGPLPNDFDELASICSVRPSEYKLFEQVFEQVLKQKFKENDKGRLENEFAKEIIQKRQQFKDKRSNSGKLSYVIRYASKNFKLNKSKIEFIKDNADLSIDLKNEHLLKQMLEQILELYINVNVNVNVNKDINEEYKILENLIPLFPIETRPQDKSDISKWNDEIRKLIEIDGATEDEIMSVVRWGRSDNFWQTNFLSLLKLRKKNKENISYFDVFKVQMNKEKHKSKQQHNSTNLETVKSGFQE